MNTLRLKNSNKTKISTCKYSFRLHDIKEFGNYFNKPFSKLGRFEADLVLFSIPNMVLKRLYNHEKFKHLVPTFELSLENLFEKYHERGDESQQSLIQQFSKSNLKQEMVEKIVKKEKNN